MTLPVIPPILNSDRVVSYSPVVSTTDFNITFPVFDTGASISVYVNGVSTTAFTVLSPSGSMSLLVKPVTDAYVRLTTAVSSGTVTIVGDINPSRIVQATAAFTTRDFNFNFSLVAATLREIWRGMKRSIKAPPGETTDLLLPSATSRASLLLGFDASGLPTTYPASGSATVASAVSWVQTGASAVGRTVEDKLRETVSVFDFMTPTEIADVQAGTATNDHTAAVQAAITAATGKRLFWPAGVYSVTSLTGVSHTQWQGVGTGGSGTIIRKRGTVAGDFVAFTSKSFFDIRGIRFDAGDISNALAYSALALSTVNQFTIENCRFIKFDKLGIGINAGTYGFINNNFFSKTTAASQGVNQSILIGTSAGASNNIVVSNNICLNAGIISVGPYMSFINNFIQGWKYGAGISTSTNQTSNYNVIIGNYCSSGTGIDSDGFDLKGIEAWGYFSKIIGNSCVGNSGSGILVGGQFCVVEGNFCYANGTFGNAEQAGIVAVYSNATNNAINSVIANNICWDPNGAGGTQHYGILCDYRNDQVIIADNQVHQNKTQGIRISNGLSAGTNTSISFRGRNYTFSFTWDPTSIANGATLTNVQTVAYANPGDFVTASCSINQAGLTLTAYCHTANAVTVVLTNNTGGAVDLASATFRIFGQQALY